MPKPKIEEVEEVDEEEEVLGEELDGLDNDGESPVVDDGDY